MEKKIELIVFNALKSRETLQFPPLTLSCMHCIHYSDCFPSGMLCMCYRIFYNFFQKMLKNTSGFFLNITSSKKATNREICKSLDIIPYNLCEPFGKAFSQNFSAFSSSRHLHTFQLCTLRNGEFFWFSKIK